MSYPENFSLTSKPGGYFENPRPEMLSYIPAKPERILEVGCGKGIFAGSIRKKINCEIWGIEIDSQAAKEAEKVIDKIIVDDINSAISKLTDCYFDCIVFNDVLEHLIDPFDVLKKIRPKLSNSGVVVSSIPNVLFIRNLWRVVVGRQWHYEEDGILDKTHLRFFTRASIIDMFENTGYEIQTIEGINPVKDFRYSMLNLFTLGFLSESKYLQFATVAKPK